MEFGRIEPGRPVDFCMSDISSDLAVHSDLNGEDNPMHLPLKIQSKEEPNVKLGLVK